MDFSFNVKNGQENLVIMFEDGEVRTVANTHPNYDQAKDHLLESLYDDSEVDWEWVKERTDNAWLRATNHLLRLTERITVVGEQILFDLDVIDNSLSRHLKRLISEGEDPTPLALFMENLAQNPSAVSRRRLFRWMQDRDFTLTDDGLIVGYKGVKDDEKNSSVTAGNETVYVNGEEFVGHIPNPLSAVVEMPRALVDPDITATCSVGLHVGTYSYASGFGSRVLTVLVNPRDVVEVPTDCNGQKIRTCRYVVKDVEVTEEVTAPTLHVTEENVTRGSDTWEDDDEDSWEDDYEDYDNDPDAEGPWGWR